VPGVHVDIPDSDLAGLAAAMRENPPTPEGHDGPPRTVAEVREVAPAIFGGMFGDPPIEARVEYVRNLTGQTTTVDVTFYDGEKVAGTAVRFLNPTTGTVTHENFSLLDEYRRHGVARDWQAHVEVEYARHGYRKIQTHAAGDDGWQVWARLGWRFQYGQISSAVLKNLANIVRDPTTDPSDRERAASFLERDRTRGDEVTPREILDAFPAALDYGWYGEKRVGILAGAKGLGGDEVTLILEVMPDEAVAGTKRAERVYVRDDEGRFAEVPGMTVDMPRLAEHADQPIPWSPSMTVEQAEQWSEGTEAPGPWFHGTSGGENARVIREEGFVTRRSSRNKYGPGLYLVNDLAGAARFGSNPLEFRVNATAVARVRFNATEDEVMDALDVNAAYVAAKHEGKSDHEAFLDAVESSSFDALFVGDEWLVVFKREAATVVASHQAVPETTHRGFGAPRTKVWERLLDQIKRGPSHVRTPEGADKYDQPIGSVIVPGTVGTSIPSLTSPAPAHEPTPPRGFRAPTDDERKALAIPPGWTDVELAEDYREPGPRLVAKGRDAAGRAQAMYNAEHHANAAQVKYERVRKMLDAVPALDEALARDAGDDVADSLLLVRRMGLRPGSTSDTKAKVQAYGATTLLREHVVHDEDGKVRLRFTGKKGVKIDLAVDDLDVAAMLLRRTSGRGKKTDPLFPNSNAARAREYMVRVFGSDEYTPKDLRTMLGTATALKMIEQMPVPKSVKEYKKARLDVGKAVAARLGNRPAQALESYISPAVFRKWDEAGIVTEGIAA
jgi:DNA topoisomerase IB